MFNLDYRQMLMEILYRLPLVLIALPVHEFAHGLAAYKLGDSTAKLDGRLSLNPLRHLDPLGTLLILWQGFGWAKPVAVNPRCLKNPKGDMAIISFCGPLSNFLLAFIFALILYPYSMLSQAGPVSSIIYILLREAMFINVGLGVFNMLPLPPLDGLKVFASILPDSLYYALIRVNPGIGMVIILALAWTGILSRLLSPVDNAVAAAIFSLAGKIYFFL